MNGKDFSSREAASRQEATGERRLPTPAVLFVFALLLRAVVYVVVNLGVYEGGLGHPDSVRYHDLAERGNFAPADVLTGRLGFVVLLRAVYFLAGISEPHVAMLVLTIMGAALVWPVYALGKKAFDHRTGIYAAVLFAAAPGFAYWSTQLLKDTVVLWLVAGVAWIALSWERPSGRRLGAVAMLLAALVTLRPELAIALAALFGLTFQPSRRGLLRKVVPTFLALLGAAAVTSFLVPFTWLSAVAGAAGEGVTLHPLHLVNEFRISTAVPSHVPFFAQSLPKFTFDSLVEMIAYAFASPILLLVVPLPWHASNLFEVAFLPDIVWWLAVGSLAIIGAAASIRRSYRARVLALFILAMGVPLTLLVTSTAAFMRWRLPLMLLALPLAGEGLNRFETRLARFLSEP